MSMACLKEPVPSSVGTRPIWTLRQHQAGTPPLLICKERTEHKWRPSQHRSSSFGLAKGAATPPTCNSANSVSVRQTVSRNFHAPMDVGGHHGCTPKVNRIRNSFVVYFSRSSSSFSAFRSWKSPTASSSTEHRAAAFLIWPKLMSG